MGEDEIFNCFFKVQLEGARGCHIIGEDEAVSLIVGQNVGEEVLQVSLISTRGLSRGCALLGHLLKSRGLFVFLDLKSEQEIRPATSLIGDI